MITREQLTNGTRKRKRTSSKHEAYKILKKDIIELNNDIQIVEEHNHPKYFTSSSIEDKKECSNEQEDEEDEKQSNSEQKNDQDEGASSEAEYSENIDKNKEDFLSCSTNFFVQKKCDDFIECSNDISESDWLQYCNQYDDFEYFNNISENHVYDKSLESSELLESLFLENILDEQKNQAQIGLSKSCNISNISIPPNFVKGTADDKDVGLITNQNSSQNEVGISNDQVVDQEKHTTVTRVLNFEESVSKTTNINSIQNAIFSEYNYSRKEKSIYDECDNKTDSEQKSDQEDGSSYEEEDIDQNNPNDEFDNKTDSEQKSDQEDGSSYEEEDIERNNPNDEFDNKTNSEQKSDQDENTCTTIEVFRSKNSNNDLHDFKNKKYKSLYDAAREGDISDVKYLLIKDTQDHDGWTALHHAAYNGHDNIAAMLLEHNADIINTKNSMGFTALHYAARNGNDNIAAMLLKHNANVDATDPDQSTALHHAAYNGHDNIAVMLLERNAAIINTKNSMGFTALHYAARNGNDNIAAMLLKHNANVGATTPNKSTALHHAAYNGHDNIAVMLLERNAAIINTKNSMGFTALHFAIMTKYVKVIQVLLGNKLIDISISDNDGDTPYALALACRSTDIINLFRSKQHPNETESLKINNTAISDNLQDCGLKFNQSLNHESLSDFQQPALHKKQHLNADDKTIVDIFDKKIRKYKFEQCKIDVEIREVQPSYFLIEKLDLKRTCTKNEGNHILPVSTIFNLIKKFIETSKKNPVNDCIKVAEKLLSTFVSHTHIHDEIQAYYDHLRDIILNKKREKLSTISNLKGFLEYNLIPFILYVWDNRITSNFYEKRTKTALGQEGSKIQSANKRIMELLDNEISNLQQYQGQIESIRQALLSTIDLPIIITRGLKELEQDEEIDKYFNCIMLFLVKNLIVTIKNGTYANTLLYMEELNANIKSLKNLDNDSLLKDLQKIVGIKNTLNIEDTIEQIKKHHTLHNETKDALIFNNIIEILEAVHIENNINEVLQDRNLHLIYDIYISFIEKKDKSSLSGIKNNVKSYKQKLEKEQSTAEDDINNECVPELQQNLTKILDIIEIWDQCCKTEFRLDKNEQKSVRNIVKEYLESITYDIVKLLHVCISIIDYTSISHYEFQPGYIKIRNNLLKITSCGKALIAHHGNNILDLRKGMLKKICEELSDNDYSVYLSTDTNSVQDNHDFDNIAKLQYDVSCSQFFSLFPSCASYSSDDITTIMQSKWQEEDLKVFLDKDALLKAVKNKPIQYVIFIHKNNKDALVHDARIIITESNEPIIEIPIVVQDKNNIKSFFNGSKFAEYNTNSYNNHYVSPPLMFDAVINKLYYALDKPKMNENITNGLTVCASYCDGITDFFFNKVAPYINQINCFLKKLHEGKSNYNCYDAFSTYLKENSGTYISNKTIEQYYDNYIKMNPGFIKALELNPIIQYCNEHSGPKNVQDFIKRIQTMLPEDVYKGIDDVEAMGLDLESIRHNIHMINQYINQTVVDIDDNRIQLLFNNTNCLKILGIKDYQDGNHAIVFVKNTNSVSIIDPLNKNSSFSNSLEKLANNLLNLGIKFINVIYSGLQQTNSGVCADISLILVKNLADKLQDIQSVQDIIEIIQDIRIEMYGKASEKNQEAITIKSFDAINTLTKLDSCAVGIQDKEKQQDNYYANNEFINTLKQDGFFIKPVELIGNVL